MARLSDEVVLFVVNRLRESGIGVAAWVASGDARAIRIVADDGVITDLPIIDALFLLGESDRSVFATLYEGRRGQTYDPAHATFPALP